MIWVYLRRTEDWDRVSIADLTVCRMEPRAPFYLRLWERAFGTSYCQYRSKLKRIAERTWNSAILGSMEDLSVVDDDDFVVPTDDDDWFHPDLANFIENEFSGVEFAHWDGLINQSAFAYRLTGWSPDQHEVGSNMYAVRGSLLKRLDRLSIQPLLEQHTYSRQIAARWGCPIKQSRERMSCYNWHPGSWSSCHTITDYLNIPRLRPRNRPPQPTADWLEPHYGQLVEVVDSLGKPGECDG